MWFGECNFSRRFGFDSGKTLLAVRVGIDRIFD